MASLNDEFEDDFPMSTEIRVVQRLHDVQFENFRANFALAWDMVEVDDKL